MLKDRVVGFEIHDLHAFNASGHDVPLGTGVGKMQQDARDGRQGQDRDRSC